MYQRVIENGKFRQLLIHILLKGVQSAFYFSLYISAIQAYTGYTKEAKGTKYSIFTFLSYIKQNMLGNERTNYKIGI